MTVSLSPHRRRRVLNWNAAFTCAIACAGTIAGFWLLHEYQLEKTVRFLKAQGHDALAAGDWTAAITSWDRCLSVDPKNPVRAELAMLLIRHGDEPDVLTSAWSMQEALLIENPDDLDIRQRQAELAHRLGRFADAESHLKTLRRQRSGVARVWYLSGVIAERMERPERAITFFRRAKELQKDDPDTTARLADLITRHELRPVEAETLLNDLICRNPTVAARRVRAAWLLAQGRFADAEHDMWAGLQIAPAEPQLLEMLVSLPRANAQDSQHLFNHLAQQLARHPDSAVLRIYFAHAQWQAGREDAALLTLRDGVARNPRETRFHESLVDFHASRGEADQAREILALIPRSRLSHAAWHYLRGRIDMADGNLSAAEEHFEKAAGFAGHDLNMQSRAQMCLGICRRAAGERNGTVEAFRSLVRINPRLAHSHLGLAAAWLESGQTDLAIAEYRQLLHHDGVPALLASLLIREAESAPEGRRNWREVERLLSDEQPLIEDRMQRTLLQAELLFAKNLPAQAIRHLDVAAERWPDHPDVRATTHGLLTRRRKPLITRLRAGIERQPDNVEMHTALLRVIVENGGLTAVNAWINEFLTGSIDSTLAKSVRQHVVAQAAEAAAVELRRESPSIAKGLLDASRIAWQQLVAASDQHLPHAMGFFARYQNTDSLLTALRGLSPTLEMNVRAECWLEAVRCTQNRESLRVAAEDALRAMISQSPSNTTLWLAYADYLIWFERYEDALLLLRQAVDVDPRCELAHRRAAWVLTMSNGDLHEALALSETAIRLSPFHPDVLAVRGLVLASSDNPAGALSVFDAIPPARRSDVSHVYEALARARSGQTQNARQRLTDLCRSDDIRRWYPADQKLLEAMIGQFGETTVQTD